MELIALKMLKRVAPYIFYDSNFLSSDEINSISSELDSWDDWIPAHAGKYKDDKLVASQEVKELRDVLVNRRSLSPINENFLRIKESLQSACELYNISELVSSRYVVSKYIPGCHIKPHTDTDFFNTLRIFTGVYYLNSEYEGGEIYFPKFGVEIKPEAGSLILFFSEYIHGVRPIISGNRFSIVWFGLTPTL